MGLRFKNCLLRATCFYNSSSRLKCLRTSFKYGGAIGNSSRNFKYGRKFSFRGTDVEKKVSVLSGGERARACLAGLLLTKSQVILLDEPTNHLDFETVEALGRALKAFAGTLFLSVTIEHL